MIYRNLSIAAGGGVIDHNLQSEQEECANIFIGLGGTGISCLREVKAQVYNRLKPDSENSDVPEYKHIQFLAIDTDESSLGDDGSISTLDSVTEFENIGTTDIHSIITDTELLRQNKNMQWFTDNISIQNAEAGAGGVRQIGRLLVMQNVDRIVSALTRKIDDARQNLEGKSVNIHIFTGMGGGTGAGIFLDICYILKHVLKELAISGLAQTCGYFFLPDVNLARVNTETIRKYIEINGFAAMKELDYCMSFENNHGEWNQNYGSFTVRSNEQPVKLAHLITAKDENGNIKTNGYNYAMNVVVDYVMEFMTKEIVNEQNRKNGDFGLKSHISNFRNIVKMLDKKRGACHDYCVLGASSAFLPYKDIKSYLAALIYKKYESLPKTNHDVDKFVTDIGLSYQDIVRSMGQDAPSVPIYEVDKNIMIEQCAGLAPDGLPPVLAQMRNSLATIKGAYSKNRDNLSSTIIVNILHELKLMCTDLNKGPKYAALMLSTDSRDDRDLGNIIEGYIDTTKTNISMAYADLNAREEAWQHALRGIQNIGMFESKKQKANNCVNTIHSIYTKRAEILLYENVSDLLISLKEQVKNLSKEFFVPFIEMLNNVSETFNSNLETLSIPDKNDADYAVKIIDLEDDTLKEFLEKTVSELNTDNIVKGFIEYMLEERCEKIWRDRSNTDKIATIVSDYFAGAVSNIANKDIDHYLSIKYGNKTGGELSKAIYDNIMIKLQGKAKPLFWVDKRDGGVPSASKIGYISVPDTSQTIKSAAGDLCNFEKTITMRESEMVDRISLLVFYCGMPMYMFKGTYNYLPKYYEKQLVGKHLYEGTALDPRDFRKLHDIIPFTCITGDSKTESTELFGKDYNYAIARKIIDEVVFGSTGSTFEMYLRVVDKQDVQNFNNRIDRVLNEKNVERAKKFLESEAGGELFKYNDSIILPQIGSNGRERDSVKDIVFASTYLTEILREQIQVVRSKESKIAELNDFVNSEVDQDTNINNFAEALCTGAIGRENEYTYVYYKGDSLYSDKYTLTEYATAPYGDKLPLYSAFVNYCSLDKDDKDEIAALVQNYRINDGQKCRKIAEEIKGYIDSDTTRIIKVAEAFFSTDKREIISFMEQFSKKVDVLVLF